MLNQEASTFINHIAKWLLLFLEYDSSVVYKPIKSHLVVEALLQLSNLGEPIGIPNQEIDVYLFILELVGLQDIHSYLSTKSISVEYFVD